jgi:hypothetical protein
MSRRIETGTATPMLGQNDKPADYLGRLVGYIPAEIIALYLTATGLVPSSTSVRQTVLWWIFGLCTLLTPVALYFATWDPKKGPLYLQVILATIAFPVWAFAIGGPFSSLSWYESWIASLILIFVTFGFGLIKPKIGS